MNRKHLYLVTAALGLAFLAACSGDSPEAKKRLLETANKYHASGKYKVCEPETSLTSVPVGG